MRKASHNTVRNFALVWSIPTDFSWIRDNGPIFIKNDKAEKLQEYILSLMAGEINLRNVRSIKELPKYLLINKLQIRTNYI